MGEGVRICTTEAFWQAMCRQGFVRTGKRTGRDGNQQFICVDQPPEDVPGFIEAKAREMLELLPPPRPWLRFRGFWSRVWNR